MIKNYQGKDIQGTVLRITKASVYDGSGFRTVVFLKGCPLRCKWCSTPESYSKSIQTSKDGTIEYGKVMTVEEVMVEVRKDMHFYYHSGGGMTVSGGEVLMQPEFSQALIRRACTEGINTAIETSFFGRWEDINNILACTNTAFVDQKIMDPELHLKYTGVSNELILENIKKAGSERHGYDLVIRRPMIPGINDSKEELTALGQFLGNLPGVTYLQLLPYHRLGTDTYRKLGMDYPLPEIETPDEAFMKECKNITERYIETVI